MRYRATVVIIVGPKHPGFERASVHVQELLPTLLYKAGPVVTVTTELFGLFPAANLLGIPVLTTAIFSLGRLCLAIILFTISYRRPKYYLSERYHCAIIIIEAIIAIETKSRPKYASTFRNTIQNSEGEQN